MKNSYWLWYPGDFELYHAMRQNFSRVERGFGWPAFWKSEGFRNRVVFLPVRTEAIRGGFLYEFETELTASLWIKGGKNGRDIPARSSLTVFCGESREEALAGDACYYSWHPDPETGR